MKDWSHFKIFRGRLRQRSEDSQLIIIITLRSCALGRGRVSTGSFTPAPAARLHWWHLDRMTPSGIGDRYGQLGSPGPGFIGFRFNNGAGIQYGWARVKMPQHFTEELPFELSGYYAYADPGEPITAGQRSSGRKAPDQGSLGWLALGASGLLAWRKSRSRLALSS